MWELHADGSMTGAHLSGDDPPFVHQDRGELAPEIRDEIWAAARAVLAAPEGGSVPGVDTVTLWIRLSDGTTVERAWRTGAAPSDPALQALLELVTAHHIGGW
ncbi:MAG: hypothetical protein IT373_05450 [Polyangiaceae bacterium]|nr:hypothetical protein [Polyangiaceae bacterium]